MSRMKGTGRLSCMGTGCWQALSKNCKSILEKDRRPPRDSYRSCDRRTRRNALVSISVLAKQTYAFTTPRLNTLVSIVRWLQSKHMDWLPRTSVLTLFTLCAQRCSASKRSSPRKHKWMANVRGMIGEIKIWSGCGKILCVFIWAMVPCNTRPPGQCRKCYFPPHTEPTQNVSLQKNNKKQEQRKNKDTCDTRFDGPDQDIHRHPPSPRPLKQNFGTTVEKQKHRSGKIKVW